jgi:hypothetical protein
MLIERSQVASLMSAKGHKRTYLRVRAMSAHPLEADI